MNKTVTDKKKSAGTNTEAWHKRHKALFVSLILLGLITGLIFGIRHLQYLKRLSDKDYSSLSSLIDKVYPNMGIVGSDKASICYYNNPQFFSYFLECYTESVEYLTIDSPEQAKTIAQNFEKNIHELGQTQGDFLGFYETPENGVASLRLTPSAQKGSCTAKVQTGQGEQLQSLHLAQRDLTGKIALFMSCGGRSREQYFPLD